MVEKKEISKPYQTIGVLGAGAWGTALGVVSANAGRRVVLWARESDVMNSVNITHENARFLPGVSLSGRIAATSELCEALQCDALLVAVPAQYVRSTLGLIAKEEAASKPTVLCAKGIERETGLLVTEIFGSIFPDRQPAILSGPSFAADVARGLPTAVTIAGETQTVRRLQASLGSASFRPYASDDPIGVALGGAAKNVYAIACGIVDGLGLGESARAALIGRSFAELIRLGEALGGKSDTLMGLSGLGDLVLTATSRTSRNFALGRELGRGLPITQIKTPGQPLAEGVDSAPALVERARAASVDLPIAQATAAVLSGALQVHAAVERLMSRPLTAE